jgi:protease-4
VSVNTVKSAPLKAEPSPFSREEVPGARDVIVRLVDDTYQWFVDIVAERRKLPREEALRLADGAVYSGRQALALKLVDAVGEEDAAVAWLETTRGVEKDLPVIDRRPASGSPFDLSSSILGAAAGILGFDLRNAADQAMLDGLVSVWHPPIAD